VVSRFKRPEALAGHGFTLGSSGEVEQLAPFTGAFSARAAQIGRHIETYEADWRVANPGRERPRATTHDGVDRAQPAGVQQATELEDRRIEPLHVADLALAVRAGLRRDDVLGVHEIGGPAPVTYRELLAETMAGYRKRRPTMNLPIPAMKIAAFVFERVMPDPPVTVQQLDLLAVDNTPRTNAMDQVFGIRPRAFLGGGLAYLSRP